MDPAIDEQVFRAVMGLYPTGVAAITAATERGPAGMIVGTFSSVSLDPPLVAYMPSRSSSSYARLRESDTFCANVLSADQEVVCRALSAKSNDEKFATIELGESPRGIPIIRDCMAWIECRVERVIEAGDHDIVIGRVTDMGQGDGELPLLFLGGGFGRFTAHSRVMAATGDTLDQLRLADAAREHLEDAADALGLDCSAVTVVGDEVVRAASAGTAALGERPVRVGMRLPLAAPIAPLLVAWADRGAQTRWVRMARPDATADEIEGYIAALARVRERGSTVSLHTSGFEQLDASIADRAAAGERSLTDYALHAALGGPDSFDPPADLERGSHRVRNVSVPVRMGERVPMYFAAFGFGPRTSGERVQAVVDRLSVAAAETSAAIAG